MREHQKHIWTSDEDTRLTALWNEKPPLSTKTIGLRMGMSKNAVIGRAHRLALPPRASPLKNPPARKLPPAPTRARCQYIDGDDFIARMRRGEDVYCGAPTVPGTVWCAEHRTRATVAHRAPNELERRYQAFTVEERTFYSKLRRNGHAHTTAVAEVIRLGVAKAG